MKTLLPVSASNFSPLFFFLALILSATLPGSAAVGETVGPVTVQTLDGAEMSLENYAERNGTVVVFLSARCPHTDRWIKDLEALHEKYRFERILMVGIASNPEESGEELRAFCQRKGVRFPVYRDPRGEAARKFGAKVTPEAFLVNESGIVVHRSGITAERGIADLEAAAAAFHSSSSLPKPSEEATVGTPIDQPAPARIIDDPYGTLHFSSELLFHKAGDAAAHHCSTLAEAANGDLICVWYGGSYESADDQTLFLSRRKKGERTWSEPESLIRNSLTPPGNAVVFKDPKGRIRIVWGRMEGSRPLRRGSGWSQCRLMERVSEDHGVTWSEDREFPIGDGFGLPRNIPITLANGDFLIPLNALGSNGISGAMGALSSDGGETWRTSEATPRYSQPTVIQRSDGSLLAYLRSEPRIAMTESHDGGLTWSDPEPTQLRCPGAGIAMTRLKNGHLVLVFNDSEDRRTPLSIALSRDEGRTWETPLELESNPGEYSYPSVMQTEDGIIHIVYTFRRYTIKHVEMNEDWLIHSERPN